ncbi:MAG TPA: carboxypeptidase-like regulatory domain-containing protein, partial [Blastocatellia bacterium]|nr:carboxypeptidase-like regulatory domain-containing protein [Blastocatellia bacterium]
MKIQPAVTRPAVLILIIGVVFSVQFVGDRKATSETLAQDLSSSATKRTNASDTITGIVLDSSGHPVSGITVDAMPPGLSDDSFRFRQETKTDVGGKFSFEGLPDKAFVLSVQAFSFSNNSEIHVPGDYVVFHIEKGGVITGRVTDINGYPVVHVRVRLEKVKRSDGKPLGRFEQEYTFGLQRSTDDRGIYRIWDVPPGSYLVAAGGKNNDTSPMVTQYDEDAPTYYPSATLGSATPVAVNSGQEIPGIDIQYKGDSGHSITGFVKSTTQSSKNSDLETGVDIFSSSGRYVGNADVADDESNSFVLPNLTDGEYKVVGYRTTNEDLSAISAPITVKIKGNDVNGIVLNIVPLAVISAHVTLDANPQTDCKSS